MLKEVDEFLIGTCRLQSIMLSAEDTINLIRRRGTDKLEVLKQRERGLLGVSKMLFCFLVISSRHRGQSIQ